MIAEIVSLSGYESQVSALLHEDERIAMEFFIACAPEDQAVIPDAGAFRVVYFLLADPGRIYIASM